MSITIELVGGPLCGRLLALPEHVPELRFPIAPGYTSLDATDIHFHFTEIVYWRREKTDRYDYQGEL